MGPTTQRFAEACTMYRQQVLDALRLLEEPHPFSAVTLACCAIDLLAHTVHRETTGEDAFARAVKRMEGYDGAGIPELVYELRCGLVHEFRTHGELGRIAITGGSAREPYRTNGVLVIEVGHFCKAVRESFENLFKTEDAALQRAFIDRAFIHVMELPQEGAARSTLTSLGANDSRIASSTSDHGASGTGGQYRDVGASYDP
jgi:hypothetical protein